MLVLFYALLKRETSSVASARYRSEHKAQKNFKTEKGARQKYRITLHSNPDMKANDRLDIQSKRENFSSATNLVQLSGRIFSVNQSVPVIDPELTRVNMIVCLENKSLV